MKKPRNIAVLAVLTIVCVWMAGCAGCNPETDTERNESDTGTRNRRDDCPDYWRKI